ncbi:hypothetical protein PCE1_001605 [Barthelona sp. PCE]
MSVKQIQTMSQGLEQQIDILEARVSALEDFEDESELLDEVNDLDGMFKKVRLSKDDFALDIEDLDKNSSHYHRFLKEVTDFSSQLDDINNTLNSYRRRLERKGLLKGTSARFDLENVTVGQKVSLGVNVSNKTTDLIDQLVKQGNDIHDTAVDHLTEVQRQTLQMEGIVDTLDNVISEGEIASKQVREFMRTISSDKMIMAMIIVLILGIVFIVAYKMFINPDANINIPDEDQF